MKLSKLLKLSEDKDVSPDFTAKLMTKLLQHERETTVVQVMVGMQVGWVMGAASASQNHVSTRSKRAYTYTDYINRGKPQSVVRYDTSTSEYTVINEPDE